MKRRRVLVLGASGFVGTTLVEQLLTTEEVEVVPVIHGAGSAWRLARLGLPLLQANVMDPAAVRTVLQGSDCVVNCTRGPSGVMIKGLSNILDACFSERVGRFVHLSSVSVYGDPPHPSSVDEYGTTISLRGPDSYGRTKLRQDRMVEEAASNGLTCVILCPPNITGPFSPYLVSLAAAIRDGSFSLLDQGVQPCNVVDVRNLCYAIQLAIDVEGEALQTRRLFITDGDYITWAMLTDGLRSLFGNFPLPRVDRETVLSSHSNGEERLPPLSNTLRRLASPELRAVLRDDPRLAKVEEVVQRVVSSFGGGAIGAMRRRINGPARVESITPTKKMSALTAQQLRGVVHSNARAQAVLGYRPLVDFGKSMEHFRDWYQTAYGYNNPFRDLLSHLVS